MRQFYHLFICLNILKVKHYIIYSIVRGTLQLDKFGRGWLYTFTLYRECTHSNFYATIQIQILYYPTKVHNSFSLAQTNRLINLASIIHAPKMAKERRNLCPFFRWLKQHIMEIDFTTQHHTYFYTLQQRKNSASQHQTLKEEEAPTSNGQRLKLRVLGEQQEDP